MADNLNNQENNTDWMSMLFSALQLFSPQTASLFSMFFGQDAQEQPETDIAVTEPSDANDGAERSTMDATNGTAATADVAAPADAAPITITHKEMTEDTFDWEIVGDHYEFDASGLASVEEGVEVADADMANRGTAFGKSYLEAAEILYAERNNGASIPVKWDDQDLADWADNRVSWYQNNMGSVASAALSGTDRENAALLFLVDMNNKTEKTWGDFAEGGVRMVADVSNIPSVIAGFFSFGAATVTAEAAKQVARAGAKTLIMSKVRSEAIRAVGRSAALASVEGAVTGAVESTARQNVEMQIKRQDEFSYSTLATDTAVATVASAGMGAGFHLAGRALPALSKKLADKGISWEGASAKIREFFGATPANAAEVTPTASAVADAPAADTAATVTPAAATAPQAPNVPDATASMKTKDIPDAAAKPTATPTRNATPQVTPAPLGGGFGPMTMKTSPGPFGIKDITANLPPGERSGVGSGGGAAKNPGGDTAPKAPRARGKGTRSPEFKGIKTRISDSLEKFNDDLDSGIPYDIALSKHADRRADIRSAVADANFTKGAADNLKKLQDDARAAVLESKPEASKPATATAAAQEPATATKEAADATASKEAADATATKEAADDSKPKVKPNSPPNTSLDHLLTKDGYYDNRVRGGVTREIAEETLKVTNPTGKKGSRTDSRTVKHFHDNLRDSIDRFQAALRKDGADFEAEHTKFQKEIIELHQSATRMGQKVGNDIPKGLETSPDGATLTYGTYESGIKITRTQREGLRVTLDKALDLGAELRALDTKKSVEDFLQGVARRAQNIADGTPLQEVLDPRDALILASWKHGSNTGKSGKYEIGVTNVSQIRLLRYTIEEASDLYARDTGPSPFAIPNAENVGGRLRKLIRISSDSAENQFPTNMNSEFAPFATTANKILDDGIMHGLTTADLVSELNMAVARTKIANPFLRFSEVMTALEEKLAEKVKANGELVESIKHSDGRVEITDPAVTPLLKRLRAQQEVVWNKNNQGTTVKPLLWGKSPEGSTTIDERTMRENASYSLNVKNSALRYRVKPDGGLSAAGIALREVSPYRKLGAVGRMLYGDTLDIAKTREHIKADGSGFAYAWKAPNGEEAKNVFTKMLHNSLPGRAWNNFLKRPAKILYRIHGLDALPNAIKFAPDHWLNGNMQKFKHNNPMRAAYAANALVGGGLLYATGSSPLIYGYNFVDDARQGDWVSAISPFHDSPEPDTSEKATTIATLKESSAVETVLAAAPFGVSVDDANIFGTLTHQDLIDAIRERAAALVVAGESDHSKAATEAAFDYYLATALEASGSAIKEGSAEFKRLRSFAVVDGVNPGATGVLASLEGIVKEAATRYTDIRAKLEADLANLPSDKFPAGHGVTAANAKDDLDAMAHALADMRAGGKFADLSDDARKDRLVALLLEKFDLTGDGVVNAADAKKAAEEAAESSTSALTSMFQGTNGKVPQSWAETGDAAWTFVNNLTDHDNDGQGVFVDTALGRTVAGTAKNLWNTAATGVGNMQQTRSGQQTLNGLMAFGGALFAPWALSKLPGFGWLNSRGISTLVIFAAFFLGWKTLNGAGGLGNIFKADDGESGKTEGDVQGEGGHVAKGKGFNVKTQSHEGGLPQIITIEGDFDDDESTIETLNLFNTDADRDNNFVAQLVTADGKKSFVSPDMLNGTVLQGMLNLTPKSDNPAVATGTVKAGKEITFDFITKEGETTPSSSVLRIGGTDLALPMPVLDDTELDDTKLKSLESADFDL